MENNRVIKNILIFVALVLFAFLLKNLKGVLLPFVLAFFLFIIVNPLMGRLDRLHVPKALSIVVVMALVAFVLLITLRTMISAVTTILSKIPEYITKVNTFDNYISEKIRDGFDMSLEQFPGVIKALNIDWVGQLKSMLTSVSTKSFSFIGKLGMVLLYLLFLLLERTTIFSKIERLVDNEKKGEVTLFLSNISSQTSRYITIKILISLLTGLLFYLAAIIVKMDFPFVWGTLAFALNFIPTLGSIFITVVITLFSMIQFLPSWGNVIFIFVFCLITQMLLGNIIEPRLQGSKLNLSPLVILLMLALWNYIWGIIGMVIAVPLTSVLQVIFNNIPSLNKFAILLSSGRGKKGEDK